MVDSITVPRTVQEVQERLHAVGFGVMTGPIDGLWGPQTEQGVTCFQEAFFSDERQTDGVVGPITWERLDRAASDGGFITQHFRVDEFAQGDGAVRVRFDLAAGLERLRDLGGGPLPIVSGYRSPEHNAAVGGAAMSAHLYGLAADVPPTVDFGAVIALGWFSGIGRDGDTGLVRHVDVRHVAWPSESVGGGTQTDPALWVY